MPSTAVATKNLYKGQTVKKRDIKFQRPQAGDFLTKDLNKILNKKLSKDIKQNEHFKRTILNRMKKFYLLQVQELIMER